MISCGSCGLLVLGADVDDLFVRSHGRFRNFRRWGNTRRHMESSVVKVRKIEGESGSYPHIPLTMHTMSVQYFCRVRVSMVDF